MIKQKIKAKFTIFNIEHKHIKDECYPDIRLHCFSTDISSESISAHTTLATQRENVPCSLFV